MCTTSRQTPCKQTQRRLSWAHFTPSFTCQCLLKINSRFGFWSNSNQPRRIEQSISFWQSDPKLNYFNLHVRRPRNLQIIMEKSLETNGVRVVQSTPMTVLVFQTEFLLIVEHPHLNLHLSDRPTKRWLISQGHSFRLLSRSDENCSSSKTSVLSRDTWCDTPTPSIFKSASVEMLADSPMSINKRKIVSYVSSFYLHDQRLKTSAAAIISFFVNHWHWLSCKIDSIK